jgi:hypothetical protein
MVHDNTIPAVRRSRERSRSLVLEMFADMATLGAKTSVMSILRYMIACFNYRIDTVVIGSHPYPDGIVPFLGSSYSQRNDTLNTPTTDIIGQHFQDSGTQRN